MSFPALKITLVAINFVILAYVVVQIIDHYKSQNDMKSWSSAFNILSFIWLCIRGTFWFFTVVSHRAWGSWSFYALYWLANPIEFGSFMLLPLFFSQVLYPNEWKRYWKYIRPLYFFVILSIVLFQSLWAFLGALEQNYQFTHCFPTGNDDDRRRSAGGGFGPYAVNGTVSTGSSSRPTPVQCSRTEFTSDAFRPITAGCFIFLAVCQGGFGLKLAYLDKKVHERYLLSPPWIVAAVNGFLVISFLSRGLYQLYTTWFVNFVMADIPLQGDDDITFSVVVIFLIWEYLPTILLVMTITSKSMGNTRRRQSTVTHTWSWSQKMQQHSSINEARLSYPQYGVFHKIDEESEEGMVGSYNSDDGSMERPMNNRWASPAVPLDIIGLDRFEAPSSLTPPTSWLSGTRFLEQGRMSSSFSSVSATDSYPDKGGQLANFYRGQKLRSGSKGDSGDFTINVGVGNIPPRSVSGRAPSKGDSGDYSAALLAARQRLAGSIETSSSSSGSSSSHARAASHLVIRPVEISGSQENNSSLLSNALTNHKPAFREEKATISVTPPNPNLVVILEKGGVGEDDNSVDFLAQSQERGKEKERDPNKRKNTPSPSNQQNSGRSSRSSGSNENNNVVLVGSVETKDIARSLSSNGVVSASAARSFTPPVVAATPVPAAGPATVTSSSSSSSLGAAASTTATATATATAATTQKTVSPKLTLASLANKSSVSSPGTTTTILGVRNPVRRETVGERKQSYLSDAVETSRAAAAQRRNSGSILLSNTTPRSRTAEELATLVNDSDVKYPRALRAHTFSAYTTRRSTSNSDSSKSSNGFSPATGHLHENEHGIYWSKDAATTADGKSMSVFASAASGECGEVVGEVVGEEGEDAIERAAVAALLSAGYQIQRPSSPRLSPMSSPSNGQQQQQQQQQRGSSSVSAKELRQQQQHQQGGGVGVAASLTTQQQLQRVGKNSGKLYVSGSKVNDDEMARARELIGLGKKPTTGSGTMTESQRTSDPQGAQTAAAALGSSQDEGSPDSGGPPLSVPPRPCAPSLSAHGSPYCIDLPVPSRRASASTSNQQYTLYAAGANGSPRISGAALVPKSPKVTGSSPGGSLKVPLRSPKTDRELARAAYAAAAAAEADSPSSASSGKRAAGAVHAADTDSLPRSAAGSTTITSAAAASKPATAAVGIASRISPLSNPATLVRSTHQTQINSNNSSGKSTVGGKAQASYMQRNLTAMPVSPTSTITTEVNISMSFTDDDAFVDRLGDPVDRPHANNPSPATAVRTPDQHRSVDFDI